MIPRVPFTNESYTSDHIMFELSFRAGSISSLHLIDKFKHINKFYFFDIDVEGVCFHPNVGHDVSGEILDLTTSSNKLKIIGVDLF